MKTIHYLIFFLIIQSSVFSQKPSVELNFHVQKGTVLYRLLMVNQTPDYIDTIEARGKEQLIAAFNEYIAFLDFGTDSSAHQLTINLLFNERLSIGPNGSYILQCTKSDYQDTFYIPFLEPAEWISDLPSFEKKIYDKVSIFLSGQHEQFLSKLPFNKIVLTDNPLFNPIDVEWVLPFKVQDLSIDTAQTKFTINVVFINSQGQPTPKPYDAFYVGKYWDIASETLYRGGIRTSTHFQIDTSQTIHRHEVYIQKYRWQKFITQRIHTDDEDIL